MTTYLVLACLGILSASATIFAAVPGADTYAAKCKMCHAADGSGSTPAGKAMNAGSFSSPDVVNESDAELVAITANGKGKMPAFAGKLSAAQITDVVAYIRTLQK